MPRGSTVKRKVGRPRVSRAPSAPAPKRQPVAAPPMRAIDPALEPPRTVAAPEPAETFRDLVDALPATDDAEFERDSPILDGVVIAMAPKLPELLRAAIQHTATQGRHRDAAALSALQTVLEEVRIALTRARRSIEMNSSLGGAMRELAELI